MALLRDQPISCLTDWMAYDSKLSILSAQESTSIEAKSRLAQNEIETQITSFVLRHSGLSESAARQLPAKVTVTEALQRWHSMLTLSLFYADLASLQNSTLHRDQSRYYEMKTDAAKDQLFDTGLGIVNFPVPQPPVPAVRSVPASNVSRILRARIRFVDIDGVVGAPSNEFLLDMSAGQQLTVSLPALPPRVAGWLLFAGDSPDALRLSTSTPVAAGGILSVTPSIPDSAGAILNPAAQAPDRFIRYSTDLWR